MSVVESDIRRFDDGMPLLQHLLELRVRILWCMAAIIVGSSISLLFAERAILFLTAPYGGLLQVIEPTEGFSVYLRVGLTGGLALSSPLLIYQIIAFVSPGLTKRERNVMIIIVPGSLLLFVAGASFAWFVMTPAAIDFLSQFMNELFVINWTSRSFVKFVLTITLWIGLAFEMPLVLMILAWLGVVTPHKLLRGWRIAVVIISVLSAAITPTIDPFNMFLVMAPLISLYLISISLSVFPYRARKRRLS
jgi:sec-independent protein translocase protein TatC|tara:strand:- start:116 stop:862 length:747 start_codon:yes stop_codon:yes gene_type:complete